ncbi:ATP-binding protein [Ramlibacter sp. XY19]|uniref:sensor histidine kinase n=1 Tax=Ramlibacter paludis TaxID=2908000 RepID=UPI0023DA7161|nr:sensor histidine kinase [Ramlibacter paludis]MCG2594370.1 ATP-binding protein [Ramlibacter paludis]
MDFPQREPEQQIAQLRQGARRTRRMLRTLIVLLLLLLWMTFVENANYEYRQTLASVAQRDANLATAVEHYVVRVMRTTRAVHQFLNGQVRDGVSEIGLNDILRDRLRANDAFADLGLCFPDGRALAATTNGASAIDRALCDGVMARLPRDDEITVFAPRATAHGPQVPLAMRLRGDGGGNYAVAVAMVSAPTLLGIMRSVRLHDATTVALSAPDGTVLAGWDSRIGALAVPAQTGGLGELVGSTGGSARIAGQAVLVSYRVLPDWGMRVSIASAREDALASFAGRRFFYFVFCAVCTFGLVVVYFSLMRLHGQSSRRAESLIHAQAELRALNKDLDAQVRERTGQLERAVHDLEVFSFAIAHDVRAPLAAIDGFAEALEPALAAGGNEKHQHYLRRIRSNVLHMADLTRQLLELGKLTHAPLQLADVDVGALAHEVLAGLRERDPQRVVETRIEPGMQARADRALLLQVLENLVGNAWKFSARTAHARIEVGCLAEDAGAEGRTFFVRDNGAGFDAEAAGQLFQPFRRLHGADEFPGTGIGLAMVQRIVALHGGKIWFEAKPGAGATFFFTLPRAGG